MTESEGFMPAAATVFAEQPLFQAQESGQAAYPPPHASALLLAAAGTTAQPASVAEAYILPCHESVGYVAFASHTVMDTLENPRIVPVPKMPYYAYGLMQWKEQWLPLIHLDALVLAYPMRDKAGGSSRCLVLAYQPYPGADMMYGALCIHTHLLKTTVSNADTCALPDNSDLWQNIAVSCFKYQGNPTPVIDTSRLFGKSYDY